jgi:hypothetical protein
MVGLPVGWDMMSNKSPQYAESDGIWIDWYFPRDPEGKYRYDLLRYKPKNAKEALRKNLGLGGGKRTRRRSQRRVITRKRR